MTVDEILKRWQEEATPPFKDDFLNPAWRDRQARRVRALIAALRVHHEDLQWHTIAKARKLIEDADD